MQKVAMLFRYCTFAENYLGRIYTFQFKIEKTLKAQCHRSRRSPDISNRRSKNKKILCVDGDTEKNPFVCNGSKKALGNNIKWTKIHLIITEVATRVMQTFSISLRQRKTVL